MPSRCPAVAGLALNVPQRGAKLACQDSFALNLRSKLQKCPKKKGPRNPENPCYDCDRGDRIRTCDLVLPKPSERLVANKLFLS